MRTGSARTLARSALIVCAAATAAVGISLPTATARSTEAVSVDYTCTGFGSPIALIAQVTVDAPASIPRGETAPLHMTLATSMTAPLSLPANQVTGTSSLTLGGASSGTTAITGMTNPAPITAGKPIALTGGTAAAQLDTPGTTTFTPGNMSFTAMGITVNCTVNGTPPIAASTEVTA
ncbi:hypothetical protein ACH427_27965 [Streptomyces sp. NPDC020379]|uniref:hypothetical protein n=1 Tax=Streptomyces sp. NPDC020379 TaxID=3365071 RepID=UPI0037A56EC9